MPEVLRVMYSSLIAFLVLFIISKILGKKQVAQLEFIDYIIGISIGSIAAQMSVDDTVPMYHYIIAMIIFGGLDLLITLISRKGLIMKKLFKGSSTFIIEEGKLNYKNLKRTKIDMEELLAQCRIKGYFFLEDIDYCVFETSGDFSVLPKFNKQATSKQDLKLPTTKIKLNRDIIIDGRVIYAELFALNKNEKWLMQQLKIKNKKEYKKFIYCSYNLQNKKIVAYPKQKAKNNNQPIN